ncbi:MAG TPA: PIN domain-containing protein [Spirochaetota bacterium]|nr:PIN domain-containing protein [Spirochaetota bacterium]HPI89776.1 PIN domain-containing protein [Spirochaetota bacterium]HPR47605.1 PIN domain-containing protein [Spirochaetota bacterium]
MNDKFFIDTNIFIYSFDPKNPLKQKIADDLIQKAVTSTKGCISFQVIQEFINVATRKFSVPLTAAECNSFLVTVFEPLCEVSSSIELYRKALEISDAWRYSFYDSLIIAAAITANCGILYSEDMQHGQKIQGLTIKNPFITL